MHTWRNWGRNVTCRPARLAHPRSANEVAFETQRAAVTGVPLRVAGSGHSFSGIAATDGHLLLLDRMNRVLDVDRAAGLVRVEPGITFRALNRELDRHGLALRNLGDIDRQTVAGAVATATHGTGLGFGSIASEVESLELVLADASRIELSARGGDPEAFRAAVTSLGSLGVTTSITLRCVPAFSLHHSERPVALRDALDSLERAVRSSDHFELLILPYSQTAVERTNERVAGRARARGHLRRVWEDVAVDNVALELVCATGRAAPAAIPSLNRLTMRSAPRREHSSPSHRTFVTPRRVRFLEMEYAVPRAHAREAIERVLAEIHGRRLPVNFPIELRFAGPDDSFLSPLSGRESCFVACHAYRGFAMRPYFEAVEPILASLDGRPHWGKLHSQTSETLRGRYPGWGRFAAVRSRLDPAGRFTTPELERLLGPAGVVSASTSRRLGKRV
ncbi:MAG TPA: D-arabinono-1,4-lactone oxidase [Thermoleophilaceae bacterium]